MSKEDYIYKNFVFEDSARDGEATYQSDSKKTSLLKLRWEFIDETITAKGNKLVAILKMRKKKIFFELEEIEYFTEVLFSQYYREKDFKEFKESCDIETFRKTVNLDFLKTENTEEVKSYQSRYRELLCITAYCYHKLHKLVEKFENMKRNLDN